MHYKDKLLVAGMARSIFKEIYKEQKLEPTSLKIGGTSPLFNDTYLQGEMVFLEDLSDMAIYHQLEEVILRLTNHLYANLSTPEGVLIHLYGEGVKEGEIRKVMSQLNILLRTYHLKLVGGDTQLTKVSNRKRISLNLEILSKKEKDFLPAKAGQTIYCLGYVGNGTTNRLIKAYQEELKTYHQRTIKELVERMQPASLQPLAEILNHFPLSYGKMISQGGILGTLWSMSNYLGMGFEVNLREIPLNALTICLSELSGENPYKLPSQGSLIVVGEKDLDFSEIENKGWIVAEIGYLKDTKECKVIHGEEQSFVEKPQYDYGRIDE